MRSGMRLKLVLGGVFILFLAAGCSDPLPQHQPPQRTNVGNGGNSTIAQFSQRLAQTLNQIESSVAATRYASEQSVDLSRVRRRLEGRDFDFALLTGEIRDKKGLLVHARFIPGEAGARDLLEIDGPFWESHFAGEIELPVLMTHELLRLLPELDARDDQYALSRELARKMARTQIEVLGLPNGARVQIGDKGCRARRLSLELAPDLREVIAYFQYPRALTPSSSLAGAGAVCDIRISGLPPIAGSMWSRGLAVDYLRQQTESSRIYVKWQLDGLFSESFEGQIVGRGAIGRLDFTDFTETSSSPFLKSNEGLSLLVETTGGGAMVERVALELFN